MGCGGNASTPNQVFILGYSLPEADSFFRHLDALESIGSEPFRRILVFTTNVSDAVKEEM